MFPLRDSIFYHGASIGTKGLIFLCILIFFAQISTGQENFVASIYTYGFIPASFFANPGGEFWRLLTSMFMHGSFSHLFGNMWFLWVFAPALEGKMGLKRFLLLYLLSGVGAAMLHGAFDSSSSIPMVGASGAISGVLGAYFILFSRSFILTLVFPFFFTVWIPAFFYLGYWAFIQLVYGLLSLPGVAWWAHVGGFLIGLTLAPGIRPRRKYCADPFWEYWRDYC